MKVTAKTDCAVCGDMYTAEVEVHCIDPACKCQQQPTDNPRPTCGDDCWIDFNLAIKFIKNLEDGTECEEMSINKKMRKERGDDVDQTHYQAITKIMKAAQKRLAKGQKFTRVQQMIMDASLEKRKVVLAEVKKNGSVPETPPINP